MGYETLHDKLQDIFCCSSMKKEQQLVLIQAYLNPGTTAQSITNDQEPFDKALQDLLTRGLVCIQEMEGERRVFPIPIAILLKKKEAQFSEDSLMPMMDEIHSIDKWIQYPVMRLPETMLKSSREGVTVMEWLFDLHMTDWNQVFCFGDYEAFIQGIGFDVEAEWI